MFEITYNDADALERYEEEKRAYPGELPQIVRTAQKRVSR